MTTSTKLIIDTILNTTAKHIEIGEDFDNQVSVTGFAFKSDGTQVEGTSFIIGDNRTFEQAIALIIKELENVK